jgi:phosphatidylserine decarboxylase
MRIPLTRYGALEILLFVALFGGTAAAAILAWPGALGLALAAVPLAALIFVLAFFRDPHRPIPGDESCVVSPADGRVTDIVEVAGAPFVGGPAVRIGIFLSVFNVHVNRSPLRGRVAHVAHRPGGYLDARDPDCPDENEAQDLGIEVADSSGGSYPVLVRQIAGLIARRIVCRVREGETLDRGARYGMIKFGSRTELYIPRERVAALEVKIGDRVRGGLDVLARVGDDPGTDAGDADRPASGDPR